MSQLPVRILYSEAEQAFVKQLYPRHPQAEILTALPGRTWASISSMASKLGVKRELPANHTRAWSAAHEAILQEHYPTKGAAYVAPLVGRLHRTVLSKAGHMGLTRVYAPRPIAAKKPRPPRALRSSTQPPRAVWSERELAALREHYPTKGGPYLRTVLGRSQQAISDKASRLGIVYTGGVDKVELQAQRKAARAERRKMKEAARREKLAHRQPVGRPRKPVVAVVVAPVKRSPATPNLNARAEARRKAERTQQAKPKPYVTADQLRKLPAAHPARLAYTRAAYHGPAAATEAFYAAMKQAA